MRILVCIILALATARPAHSRPDSSQGRATLSVKSSTGDMDVFVDSDFLGKTPLVDAAIPAGSHIVRYLHPDHRSWSHAPLSETLIVADGENYTRTITPKVPTLVTSEPFGATVEEADTLLCTTPCIMGSIAEVRTFRIAKEGYVQREAIVFPGTARVHLVLVPDSTEAGKKEVGREIRYSSNTVSIFATGTAAILSGVAAAFFKIKADNLHAEYQRTGDQRLLDRIRSYDRVAGISLAASELSLILLSYVVLRE